MILHKSSGCFIIISKSRLCAIEFAYSLLVMMTVLVLYIHKYSVNKSQT